MTKLLLALVFVVAPVAASAQLVVERYTYTYINPGAITDFSGANYVYNNTLNLDTFAGVANYTANIQPNGQNIVFAGGGGTTVVPNSVPDFTPSAALTVTSPGDAGQFWTFDYTGGSGGFLSVGTLMNRNALTFSGGGFGLLEAGGRFYSTVIVSGDWSSLADRTAATFNANYALVDDFVFDGTNTRFTIETADYLPGENPSISFSLLGSTVPEPSNWAMLIMGFGIIGFAARRRRGAVNA